MRVDPLERNLFRINAAIIPVGGLAKEQACVVVPRIEPGGRKVRAVARVVVGKQGRSRGVGVARAERRDRADAPGRVQETLGQAARLAGGTTQGQQRKHDENGGQRAELLGEARGVIGAVAGTARGIAGTGGAKGHRKERRPYAPAPREKDASSRFRGAEQPKQMPANPQGGRCGFLRKHGQRKQNAGDALQRLRPSAYVLAPVQRAVLGSKLSDCGMGSAGEQGNNSYNSLVSNS